MSHPSMSLLQEEIAEEEDEDDNCDQDDDDDRWVDRMFVVEAHVDLIKMLQDL